MDHVICVGSVAKDIFFPTADGEFFETPDDLTSQKKVAFETGAKYQIEDRYEAIGGVAANTSVGLARLGVSVSCYGGIGDDDIGAWIRREFDREGVDARILETFSGVKSDLSAILVFTKDGERTIFYNRDSAERFLVDASKFSGASWVMMSALNGDWKENMRQTIAGAKASGARLAMNPGQKNMKDDPQLVLEVVRESDLLFLNKDEAIELSLHIEKNTSREYLNDEATLLRILERAGAKVIALTDGVRGAWGYDGKEMFHAAFPRTNKSIETTGAGDAFGSGFFAARLSDKTLSESLLWGSANGLGVTRFYGAIEGLLRRDEIERSFDECVVTRLL